MKPLRDSLPTDDPQLELAARLLQTAEPLERSVERRARVWRALNAKERPSGLPLLRPLAIIATISAATIASASVGAPWIRTILNPPADVEETPASAPLVVSKARTKSAPRLDAGAAEATTEEVVPLDELEEEGTRRAEADAEADAEAEAEADAEAEATHTADTAAPSTTSDSAPATASSAAPVRAKSSSTKSASTQPRTASPREESPASDQQSVAAAALMLEAMQARRAGDIQRAERLAADYRRQHPQGALEEEALVLSFEAAAARNDPRATQLARQYLERYPAGRFRKQAQRVLQGSQPSR